MPNAQEWWDQNYNTNKDKKITIRINGKNLTGSLKVTGFNNLNTIECWENRLVELDISGCSRLTSLNCSCNTLTDLTPFSKLVNCETLTLSNNPFTGSLVALQDLPKLKRLDIRNTNLVDLESLPKSLEKIYCNGPIVKVLANYKGEFLNQYNYTAWKEKYFYLPANAQEITRLKRINPLDEKASEIQQINKNFYLHIFLKDFYKIREAFTEIYNRIWFDSEEEELLRRLINNEINLKKSTTEEQRNSFQEKKDEIYSNLSIKMMGFSQVPEIDEALVNYEKLLREKQRIIREFNNFENNKLFESIREELTEKIECIPK